MSVSEGFYCLMGDWVGNDGATASVALVLLFWELNVCCFEAEGDPGGSFAALVPDRDVRVSVKALALSCVGAAVALHPESFFSKLYKVPLDTVEYPGTLDIHFHSCVQPLLWKLLQIILAVFVLGHQVS